jgi:hypothetical protein
MAGPAPEMDVVARAVFVVTVVGALAFALTAYVLVA